MTKKNCNICIDLIPLVKDQVASKESEDFLKEHLKACEECRELYENYPSISNIPDLEDKKIVENMRENMRKLGLIVLFLGSFLGAALSNSMGMFYNFLIMPFLGGLGYMLFKKKVYKLFILIFSISYIWQFLSSLVEGREKLVYSFVEPLYLSTVYLVFAAIGIIIFQLLQIAFTKEEEND